MFFRFLTSFEFSFINFFDKLIVAGILFWGKDFTNFRPKGIALRFKQFRILLRDGVDLRPVKFDHRIDECLLFLVEH